MAVGRSRIDNQDYKVFGGLALELVIGNYGRQRQTKWLCDPYGLYLLCTFLFVYFTNMELISWAITDPEIQESRSSGNCCQVISDYIEQSWL